MADRLDPLNITSNGKEAGNCIKRNCECVVKKYMSRMVATSVPLFDSILNVFSNQTKSHSMIPTNKKATKLIRNYEQEFSL